MPPAYVKPYVKRGKTDGSRSSQGGRATARRGRLLGEGDRRHHRAQDAERGGALHGRGRSEAARVLSHGKAQSRNLDSQPRKAGWERTKIDQRNQRRFSTMQSRLGYAWELASDAS